ncbi:D-alanyl-lipoteichoic acid biosynthesis protein DltD [Heyndrickxia sp. NPDC080065]|uniref:D-alanyl-lipoteichoic acid biosynthesis protein DltD n=1 Tax=Heyndrickxia sp. NPDC080065 TaxID=3390568 RepID=UPI003D039FA6
MKKYTFTPIIIACVLFLVFLFFPNKWIEYFITDKKVKNEATELSPLMFQGEYIQREMLNNKKYFPIYGSSELARFDPFHPSNYFEANPKGFTPFLIGRGGTQSIIQFMNFAAHADQLKGKKLVFIISPQWFHKRGIDEFHFDPNYSMLQAYDLAFNKSINPELKKAAIRRLLDFDVIKRDRLLSSLYRSELKMKGSSSIKDVLVKPLAYINMQLLEKKDLYYSVFEGFNRKRYKNPEMVKNKSWGDLEKAANNYGRKSASNNPFLIVNNVYNKKIARHVKKYKNYKSGLSFADSVEYKDFQMVLDILKEKGAKPLFISIPVNGRWYDYIGFPKNHRDVYYKKIRRQVLADGFPIADFSGHDYDPYFIKDTMHIAWKGWVYTDRAMLRHWKQ